MLKFGSKLSALVALLPFLYVPTWAFGQYTPLGDASDLGGGCFLLTADEDNEIGAVWAEDALDLSQPFDLAFSVYLGDSNNGGDGMAWVIRNEDSNDLQPNNMPGSPDGRYLGFGNINDCVIVEIDTDHNGSANDPNYDHLSVLRDGNPDHDNWTCLFDPVPALPSSGNIENDEDHTFRVIWNPANDSLYVYFDCFLRIAMTVDIPNIIGDSQGIWGFTACTETEKNEHRFCEEDIDDPLVVELADVVLCDGASATFTIPSGLTGATWSPTAGLSGIGSTTLTASPSVTTTYTLTWEDPCGNEMEASFTATVSAISLPAVVPNLSLCDGAPIEIPDILVPPGFSVGWESENGLFPSTVDTPGDYTVFVTNDEGCTDEQLVTVTNTVLPTIELGPDLQLCAGDEVTFDVGVPDAIWGDGSVGATWTATETESVSVTVGSGTCSTSDAVEVVAVPDYVPDWNSVWTLCGENGTVVLDAWDESWLGALPAFSWSDGSNDPSLEVAVSGAFEVEVNAGGCLHTFEAEVLPAEITTVDLGPDVMLCPGEMVEWSSGYPAAWSTWMVGANPVGFGSAFETDQAGSYTLIVSHNDCTIEDEAAVDVVSDYLPDPATDLMLCSGEQVALNATDSDWAGETASFSWLNGPSTPEWEVAAPGTYTVDVLADGCSFTFTVEVEASTVDGLNLGGDIALCPGAMADISSGFPAAWTSWNWNGNAVGGNSASFEVVEAGTLICTVFDGYCTAEEAIEASLVPAFNAQLPQSVSFCDGTSVPLTAAAGASAYIWTLPNLQSVNGPSISLVSAGTYALQTEFLGCISTVHVEAEVFPLPAVDLGPDIGVCEGEVVTLEHLGPADWVQWNGTQFGSTLQVSTTGSVEVVVSLDGCENSDVILVSFNPSPVFDLGPDQELCPGSSVVLELEGLPQGTNLDWGAANSNSNPLVVNVSGTYVATASLGGCTHEDEVTVLISEPYDAQLPERLELCLGQTEELAAAPADTLFATWYEWTPGGAGRSVQVDHEGTYLFQAGNACGIWERAVFVEVEDCDCSIFVPSAFTPDNDGRNDRFKPELSCEPMGYTFEVLDRWGVRFFYTEDFNEGWIGQIPDGASDDRPYFGPQDLYVWRLTAVFEHNGVARHHIETGQVVLLR